MASLRLRVPPFFRFALVGVANTGIDFAVFLIGLKLGAGLLAANALGFLAGAANSFVMNSAFTFRLARAAGSRHRFLRVAGFGAVTLASLGLSSLTVLLLAPVLPVLLAKAAATAVTLVFGFLASRALFDAIDRPSGPAVEGGTS